MKSVTVGTGLKEFGEHVFCHAYQLKTVIVKSKKIEMASTNILHGGMDKVVIKVPKKKVKEYQEDVFYAYPQNVTALK